MRKDLAGRGSTKDKNKKKKKRWDAITRKVRNAHAKESPSPLCWTFLKEGFGTGNGYNIFLFIALLVILLHTLF